MKAESNTKTGKNTSKGIISDMKTINYTLILLLFIVISASGQEVKTYTLDEAISTAYKNNSELINARLDKLKADRKVSEVYSENLLPTITLNSTFSRAFKKQVFDIFGQRFEVGTDNTFINTLSLTQSIPVLGTPVFQGIRIAEYYSVLQEEIVSGVETRVRADVKKSFYNVLFLKEVLKTQSENLSNAESNLEVVQKRYDNGVATEFDLLRAKVTVENIKPRISESQENLIIGKKYLKNSIGQKDDTEIDVLGKLEFDSTEVFGNTDDLINKIAESNVSVRQLNINRNINSELLAVDKANYLPKLYVFGQYNLQSAEDDGRSFTDYRYFSVINAGIGLTWDLNLFRNTHKKKQSELELKKTDETIRDVKNKLKLLSQSIIFKIESSKKRIIATNETVKLARRGFELAQLSYQNGAVNQIDVLDAQLQLSSSQLAFYQAVYDYLLAKIELEELLEKK